MKVMAICNFVLAGLWLFNFIIGCINVSNGRPFGSDFSVGCAYLLVVLAFINLGLDNLKEL